MIELLNVLATIQSLVFITVIEYIVVFLVSNLETERVVGFDLTHIAIQIGSGVYSYCFIVLAAVYSDDIVFPAVRRAKNDSEDTEQRLADITDIARASPTQMWILLISNLFGIISVLLFSMLAQHIVFFLVCVQDTTSSECLMVWGNSSSKLYLAALVIMLKLYNFQSFFMMHIQYKKFFSIHYDRAHLLFMILVIFFNITLVSYQERHHSACVSKGSFNSKNMKDAIFLVAIGIFELVSVIVRGNSEATEDSQSDLWQIFNRLKPYIYYFLCFINLSVEMYMQNARGSHIFVLYFYCFLMIFLVVFIISSTRKRTWTKTVVEKQEKKIN